MTDQDQEIEVRVLRSSFNHFGPERPEPIQNSRSQDFNANLNRDVDIELSEGSNRGRPIIRIGEMDQDEINKMLIFSPYYQINRYGRTLKRSEVVGFALISLTVVRFS